MNQEKNINLSNGKESNPFVWDIIDFNKFIWILRFLETAVLICKLEEFFVIFKFKSPEIDYLGRNKSFYELNFKFVE